MLGDVVFWLDFTLDRIKGMPSRPAAPTYGVAGRPDRFANDVSDAAAHCGAGRTIHYLVRETSMLLLRITCVGALVFALSVAACSDGKNAVGPNATDMSPGAPSYTMAPG